MLPFCSYPSRGSERLTPFAIELVPARSTRRHTSIHRDRSGYFQSKEGQLDCVSCDLLGDFYQELEGRTSCVACPATMHLAPEAVVAANRSFCVCKEGLATLVAHRDSSLRVWLGRVGIHRTASLCRLPHHVRQGQRLALALGGVHKMYELPKPTGFALLPLAICAILGPISCHVFKNRSEGLPVPWPIEPSLSGHRLRLAQACSPPLTPANECCLCSAALGCAVAHCKLLG